MSREILLDREGDLPVPPNVQAVENEVAFLQFATSEQSILIRGKRLCSWAEAFYALHGQSAQYLTSFRASLQHVFSLLTTEQAQEIAEKIDIETLPIKGFTPAKILTHCYPDDYALWSDSPSLQHAARWLLWNIEHKPSDAEMVILRSQSSMLTHRAGESSEADLYRVVNSDEAKTVLHRWVGAEEPTIPNLGEFPVAIPRAQIEEIKGKWMKRIIKQQGSFFSEMLKTPLPLAMRQKLASLTIEFYKDNSQYLNRARLQDIQPYVKTKDLSSLDKRVPPPEPAHLPDTEVDVLEWFLSGYLPYRRWQSCFGDKNAQVVAIKHAQSFAHWVLQQYPKWLLDVDEKWLVFQRSAQLPKIVENSLVLCVILDGLPAWDAEDFVQSVSSEIGRLTLQQKDYCFTSIPTVTQFAKEALLYGVSSRLVPQSKPLGIILPDKASPQEELRNIPPGSIVFWRVEQPDRAYHFERSDKRERKIHVELNLILLAIQEAVETLPDHIPLQIIITSDHGRLLNPKSPRQISIPEQAEIHGRAAWGQFETDFGKNGFVVNEKTGWVDISGERFEIEYDARLTWGEESFRATKKGYEPYPHGGIFPEEIIVPWFLFVRDATSPDLDISLTGTGEAEMSGELIITIVNNDHRKLECLGISLSYDMDALKGQPIRIVNSLAVTKWEISILPWPTKRDLEGLSATLLFRQPNGKTFTRKVIPDIEVKSLYERRDDILKDLI